MQSRVMWMLLAAIAFTTAACGDSKSSLNPTAPSTLAADTAGAATANNYQVLPGDRIFVAEKAAIERVADASRLRTIYP